MKKLILLGLMIYLTQSFAFAADFCVGDSAIYTLDGNHYNAKIVALYADGTAEISFPGQNYSDTTVNLSTLSAPLVEKDGFHVDHLVIYTLDGNHYDAKIVALYSDDTAEISFPNQNYGDTTVSISTLSHRTSEERGFHVNEPVVYTLSGNHYDATIVELYSDGTAQLSFKSGNYSNTTVNLSMLSSVITEDNGFAVGDPVVYTLDGNHYDATIVEIYSDHTAQLSFDSQSYGNTTVDLSTLSHPIYCEESDHCHHQ